MALSRGCPTTFPGLGEPGPIRLCHLLRFDSVMSLVSGSFSFSICKMGTIQSPSRGWRDDDMKYGNAQHRVQWWPFQRRAGPPRGPVPSLTPHTFWVSKLPKLFVIHPGILVALTLPEGSDGTHIFRSHIFYFPKTECPSGVWGRRNSQEGGFWCSEDQCPPCGGAHSQREK